MAAQSFGARMAAARAAKRSDTGNTPRPGGKKAAAEVVRKTAQPSKPMQRKTASVAMPVKRYTPVKKGK